MLTAVNHPQEQRQLGFELLNPFFTTVSLWLFLEYGGWSGRLPAPPVSAIRALGKMGADRHAAERLA